MPEFCTNVCVCLRACSNNHSCCVMSAFYLFIYVFQAGNDLTFQYRIFFVLALEIDSETFFVVVNTSTAHLSRKQEQKTKWREREREKW